MEETEQSVRIEDKPIKEQAPSETDESEETSEKEEKTLDVVDKNVEDDMEEAKNVELLSKEQDKRIEIYSRESLSSHEQDRLELVIANRKKHGGGDYDEFQASLSKKLFRVQFKSVDAKQRMLEKKVRHFFFKFITSSNKTKFLFYLK